MSLPDASPPRSPARRPWALFVVVLLGVLLHAPSLGGGFYADDHMHQLALDGKLPLKPWALYDFGGFDDWAHLQETVGGFPWWTSPDWKIRFFRPLSSALLWLDHSLWGGNAAAYHAVSLLWLAALLLGAQRLYRALGLERGVALGAVALLASSQATLYPTDWIANRNSLSAAVFIVAAAATLASHERLGRNRALIGALICAVLACLSKESGVVAFAVLAAYLALFEHGLPRAWTHRAILVACVSAALFVVGLALAGYGSRSAFYATPWSDPLRFGEHLGLLATVGSLSLLTPVASDLVFVAPAAVPALVVAGSFLGVAFVVWARRRLRGDRRAAFLFAWTVLALLPEAGAPTQDRLLLTATIGFAGGLSLLLARTLRGEPRRSRFERAVAWTLVVLASLEALSTLGLSAATAQMAGKLREQIVTADVGDRELGRRDVVVLQADDPLVAFTLPATWALQTGDVDVHFTILQTGRRALRWTRIDERTMDFESLDRPFVTDPFETVYRSSDAAIPVGSAFTSDGMRVEVTRTDVDGGVRAFRVTFDEAPEGPRHRFLAPVAGRLTEIAAPAPGESMDVPEAPPAHPFVP